MDKYDMREYVCDLEERLDRKLAGWRKESRIENGEVVQLEWQFVQKHIFVDIFWPDGKEGVNLLCMNPRAAFRYTWHGLNTDTASKVMDEVSSFAGNGRP